MTMIHASVTVKKLDPTSPIKKRNTIQAGIMSKSLSSGQKPTSSKRHATKTRRTPNRRTRKGVSSGPMITPRKVAAALIPLRLASTPLPSSSSASNGPPSPIAMPNTATQEMAAASA